MAQLINEKTIVTKVVPGITFTDAEGTECMTMQKVDGSEDMWNIFYCKASGKQPNSRKQPITQMSESEILAFRAESAPKGQAPMGWTAPAIPKPKKDTSEKYSKVVGKSRFTELFNRYRQRCVARAFAN